MERARLLLRFLPQQQLDLQRRRVGRESPTASRPRRSAPFTRTAQSRTLASAASSSGSNALRANRRTSRPAARAPGRVSARAANDERRHPDAHLGARVRRAAERRPCPRRCRLSSGIGARPPSQLAGDPRREPHDVAGLDPTDQRQRRRRERIVVDARADAVATGAADRAHRRERPPAPTPTNIQSRKYVGA